MFPSLTSISDIPQHSCLPSRHIATADGPFIDEMICFIKMRFVYIILYLCRVEFPDGTIWLFNIAMENDLVEIVDFPIENGDVP